MKLSMVLQILLVRAKEMYREQLGEYAYWLWCQGIKG